MKGDFKWSIIGFTVLLTFYALGLIPKDVFFLLLVFFIALLAAYWKIMIFDRSSASKKEKTFKECEAIARKQICSTNGNDYGLHLLELKDWYRESKTAPENGKANGDPQWVLTFSVFDSFFPLVVRCNSFTGETTFKQSDVKPEVADELFTRELEFLSVPKNTVSIDENSVAKLKKLRERIKKENSGLKKEDFTELDDDSLEDEEI